MSTSPASAATTLTLDLAVDVATKGASRLTALVEPDGRFVYRYVPGRPDVRDDQYNALRHCGAIWSILDIARISGRGRREMLPPVLRATQYMMREMIRPWPKEGALCLVDGNGAVKLGGAGLAIVALSDLIALNRVDELVEAAEGLGRYILSERTQDNDFVHKRDLATGTADPFRSNYYTGQALFGLLRLYRITGDDLWRRTAFELLQSLSEKDYGVSVKSHWMLYALDAAHAIEPRPLFSTYASRIARAIVDDPAYRSRMMSTPIACCTEGLLAYCRIARRESDEAIPPEARGCIEAAWQNLALQMRWLLPDGGFVGGDTKGFVQIDFIQHNISAFAYMADLARRR